MPPIPACAAPSWCRRSPTRSTVWPLELRGHRDLTPGESFGLVLLKARDNTATLQLRYDRVDYQVVEERAEMFSAIRRRISSVTGEALLPAMPGCSATA